MRFFASLAFIYAAGLSAASQASAPFIVDTLGETAWSVTGDAGFTPDILTDETGKALPHKSQLRPVGEGLCRWAYTLYPDTSQEIHIFWRSDERTVKCGAPEAATFAPQAMRWPERVEIDRGDSIWKTSEGIHIGTTLDELRGIAGGKVSFSGWGKEPRGRCCEGSTNISPQLLLQLSYNPDAAKLSDVAGYLKSNLTGEAAVEASSIPEPIRRKLDIRVKRITYTFPVTKEESAQ